MLVASDLDHVMCDLVGQARRVLANDLGVPVGEIVETFVYHGSLVHADPEINARIRMDVAFWEREEIIMGALPMPGAVEASWRLFDAGMLASYVTRRGPAVADATHAWLADTGLPPVPVHFVGSSDPRLSHAACKTEACRRSGATMLMDDSQEEVARVVDAGLSAILLDAPVGRIARAAFLATRPEIACLPSVVEAVDYLIGLREAA